MTDQGNARNEEKGKKRRKKKPLWETGEHGVNRVWLYRRGKRSTLYMGWYERSPNGDQARLARSLGSATLAEAKNEAEALAQSLRKGIRTSPQKDISLGDLFELYEREQTAYKGDSAQRHDRRAMPLFLRCWGATRPVIELKPMDWDHYIRQRRSGALAPPAGRGGPVRDRTLEQDLSLLRAIFHWAERNEVIPQVPMARCTIPREQNIVRPIVYEEEIEAMFAVAHLVHPFCRLALLLAHETARRSKSIRELKWQDIDLEARVITWRAETDKEGKQHTSPLEGELLTILQTQHRGASDWVFASSRDPNKPVNRRTFDDWWAEAERLAEVEHVPGRKWHSFRRKWATERKHHPLEDVAAAGGWNGTQTLAKVYVQPDQATMRKVVANRIPIRLPGGPTE